MPSQFFLYTATPEGEPDKPVGDYLTSQLAVEAAKKQPDGEYVVIEQMTTVTVTEVAYVVIKEAPAPADPYPPASLSFTSPASGRMAMTWPSSWTVAKVGRDGTDSKGNGPWEGAPSDLPFGNLIPGTEYTLYAVVQGITGVGVKVARKVKAV